MRIDTKPFGPMDIDERQLLRFPQGIFGFEGHTRWAMLDSSQAPFYWLQSLDEPALAFVILDPAVFRPDYRADVSDEDREALELEDERQLIVFAIVTIPEDQSLMTANLQGPLLINRVRRLGRQGIQTDPSWKVRHRILDEMARARGEEC